MQFSTVLSVLAMTVMASAAPEVQPRDSKDVCCPAGLLTGCIVIGSGSTCKKGHDHYHCHTHHKEKSVITIIDLDCVKVL
ncbi:hypothetical protein DL769_000140 [Monosporascus sp. CRB-8-3]|nr:hypothetical protein DL769_000140 [Monosporascus sp. CRB-8-3]